MTELSERWVTLKRGGEQLSLTSKLEWLYNQKGEKAGVPLITHWKRI
jgi:hypothetical protein